MGFGGKPRNRARRRSAAPGLRLRLPSWPALPQLQWQGWTRVAVVLAVTVGALLGVREALNLSIKEVRVAGPFERVSALQVEKAVRVVSRNEGLVGVDLRRVQQAVREIPWVDSVTVGRSWPTGLEVHFTEQVPVARWGEHGLLNGRGEVFVRDLQHVPPELAQLAGPAGTEALVTQRFLDAQSRLAGIGLRLIRVEVDGRGAWEMTLDSGVVLRLGNSQLDVRLERFIAAGSRVLATDVSGITYVDLRYANGFAVGRRIAKELRSNG
jgi:cell division protein FtsQ